MIAPVVPWLLLVTSITFSQAHQLFILSKKDVSVPSIKLQSSLLTDTRSDVSNVSKEKVLQSDGGSSAFQGIDTDNGQRFSRQSQRTRRLTQESLTELLSQVTGGQSNNIPGLNNVASVLSGRPAAPPPYPPVNSIEDAARNVSFSPYSLPTLPARPVSSPSIATTPVLAPQLPQQSSGLNGIINTVDGIGSGRPSAEYSMVVLPSGVSRPASSTAPYSLPTLPAQPVSPTSIASTHPIPPLPTVNAPVLAPQHPLMSPTPATSNASNASMLPPVTALPVEVASDSSAPDPIASHSPTAGPPNSANVTFVGGVTDLAALTANGTISCGMNPTPYIAGGANTSTVRYPYAISLRYQNDNDLWLHYCGGVLIDSRLILTAAHCCQLNPTQASPAVFLDIQTQHGGTIPENQAPKAFLGASCIAGDGIDSQYVEKVFVPSGWTGEVAGGFDVCVMRIAKEFQVDPANSPLGFKLTYPRLSNSSADLNTGSTTPGIYKAIGWGLMVGMQPAPQLREATLTQLLWETCKAIFDRGSQAISVTMGQICTQPAGGNTTCKGDSGGPLIKINPSKDNAEGDVIVGIVSAGDSVDCRVGSGNTLYSNVNAFNLLPMRTPLTPPTVTEAANSTSGRCGSEALQQIPNAFIQCVQQNLLQVSNTSIQQSVPTAG